MKRLFSAKSVAAVALGLAAVVAASAAQARSDVQFTISLPALPGVYVQPAPVYVQPRPVYEQPRPVYVQPSPVVVQQPYYGQYEYRYQDDRGYWHHQRRNGHRYGPNGDLDRDGVPNRYDRAPDNPYRR
jgi:hypothetical protein